MNKNSKENTKDKLNSGPSTTGSFGISTDANITAASAGAEDGSHDLFPKVKNNNKNLQAVPFSDTFEDWNKPK